MFGFEYYSLELKHYVILSILGIIEVVLFSLMIYNCFLEYRDRAKGKKYKFKDADGNTLDDEKGQLQNGKPPSIMEIFSVDMTLKRDSNI